MSNVIEMVEVITESPMIAEVIDYGNSIVDVVVNAGDQSHVPSDGSGHAQLIAHINDPTPHPAYDEIGDLDLLVENWLI